MNPPAAVPVCRSKITFGCATAMYPSQNTGAAFVDKKALALAKSVAVNKSVAAIVALDVAAPAKITLVQAASTPWITSSMILAMFSPITLRALDTIGTGDTSSRISEMIAYIPYWFAFKEIVVKVIAVSSGVTHSVNEALAGVTVNLLHLVQANVL
jgi:hypothetical protein